MADSALELDGAQGEGGGQILRSSLALALLTGRPFRLRHIRAGRAKPGLQPQHLQCVLAAAEIGQAQVQGAHRGSTALAFAPGAVRGGDYHFRIGTAGATSLVLHTVYLPLALAKARSTVAIEGGTHVAMSPCFHFLATTWRGYLARIGLEVGMRMERAGFYPRGGGLIVAEIEPWTAPPGLVLAASEPVSQARILSAVAGLPESIARRQAQRAARQFAKRGLAVETREESWAGGPGTMLGVELATAPVPTFFFALGERGKSAEAVADEAAAQAAAFLDTGPYGVDEHSADQLILPLALMAGASRFPTACISSHLRTNAAVIQQFLPRTIECVGADGQPGWVNIR